MDKALQNITQDISQKIKSFDFSNHAVSAAGRIISCNDGVLTIEGLSDVKNGELLYINGGHYALALNLEENAVGAILLTNNTSLSAGDIAYATGRIVGVPVGNMLLGRVINPLGEAIDGGSEIKSSSYRNIEAAAPPIFDRAKVASPLYTGIKAIDCMVPIGKGQRELIIGDRQTGKTALAIDTIINQKNKNVICIYVAIGQKASGIAKIVSALKEHDAMSYTVVVSSTANNPAPLQYIAPYTGTAIAEEFMYRGKDVLIVYDDLSKHAVAYRTISLLLRRPSGREAFPGDIFYIHSKLLERSAKLSDALGGGSLTALPIIETLAGDISAYIPTNVISITDGQIYLESELFNEGMRPAVNVGLSVSRVGGSAQTKAMRKVAGRLRLDLAQYRELSVFSQFAGELESSTREALSHGQRVTECLKQTQHMSYTAAEQIAILHTVLNNITRAVPVKYIAQFNNELLAHMRERGADVMDEIGRTGVLTDDAARRLEEMAREYMEIFFKTNDITPEREERDLKLDTHTRTNASAESAGKKQ